MAWAEPRSNSTWRAGYRDGNGTRRRLPGTYPHKRAAEQAAAAAEAEARSLGWRDPDSAKRTWGEWLTEWRPSRMVEKGTAKVDNYRLDGDLSTRWADVPLHEITRHDVKAWATQLRDEGRAMATVRQYTNLLSASLNAAVDADILPSNPAARLKLPNPDNRVERVFSKDEQKRIFAEMPTDLDRALVGFLLGTGARWGEASAIRPSHISLDHGIVRFRASFDSRMRELREYTKVKKRRTVPLQPWLVPLMQPFLELPGDPLIFATKEGTPHDYSNWRRRVWLPALDRAGIETGTIHVLRHTYASEQLAAGLTISEISVLLGHGSPSTTERYAHTSSRVNPAATTAIANPAEPSPSEHVAEVIAFPSRMR